MDLNQQIARNTKLSINATAEQRRNFAEKNRAIRAEQGLLRIQQQRSSLHLANLKQEARETRNAANATGGWSRSLRGLGTEIGALGIGALAAGVGELARNSVVAAGRLSLLTTGLENVTGSSAAAEQRLTELDAIARLPGANLDALIQYNNRLTAIGLTSKETDSVLLNVGQSIVSLGGNAVIAEQALEQISQALQQNRISLQDFRPIIQRVPGFLQAIADVHGVAPSLDGLREATENLGGSVKNALLPVLEELGDRFAAPPPESYVRSVDELQNAFFLFQATLGEQVLPAVSAVARGLAGLFDNIRASIDAPSSLGEILEGVTENFVSFDRAIGNTTSIESRNLAIMGHVSALETAREELQTFIDTQSRTGGFGVIIAAERSGAGGFGAILTDEIAQIGLLGEELEAFQGILDGSALSIDFFAGRVSDLGANIQRNQGNISQWTQAQRELAAAGKSSSDEYGEFNKRIIEANQVIEALRSEYARYNAIVALGEENLNSTALATTLLTLSQKAAAQAIADTTTAFEDGATAYAESVAAASQVRENLENLSEAQSALNDFWAVASGQLDDYAAAIQTVVPAVVDLVEAEEALNTAIDANLTVIDADIESLLRYVDALDALDEGLANIERGLDAHNAALVNPAISDAADSLRTYSDAISDVGVNFETLEDISQDVTDAIREQGTGFQTLRDDVESAEISLDDIDETLREVDDGAAEAERAISNLDRAFSRLGSNIIDFVADIASGGDVEDAFVDLGLTVGDAFVGAFEETLNQQLSGVVTDALGGTSAVAGGAGSSIAASLASALTPVAVLAGSIYTLANVVDGFVGAIEFEGREAVQVGDQTLRPIAEIRLDQEDPFFKNLRDLLSQFGGVELLQSTGNTLDRPEVRQFIRDEFPDLARELFGGLTDFGAGTGRALGRITGAQSLAESTGTDRQSIEDTALAQYGATAYDAEVAAAIAGDTIAMAIEESVEEILPGSEAGAAAAAESQRGAERDILGTNVGRAQFNLGESTDEGDFESDRQALIGTINAVHAAEAARIDALILGETALKALRDANDLDRDIALQRATTTENTFTTQRIQNEMDVADAAADAAQAKIDGIEESAAAAMEAAEAEATATERQSIADSNAQRSLLGTGVRRSRFELGQSTDEGDFELDRQTLLLSIIAVHAAEDARIDGLMQREIEIAALRAKNDLARDIAIETATGLENTFTTQRIKNEMDVAEAAAETAQAQIEAAEAQVAAQEKIAEAQRRAAEAAEVAAERQRGRESDAAAGLLQTGVGQARFDLGLSGSEGEFEINRQGLIDAANAYYDNELARINELELTEIELTDRRTANELNRQQALSRAITLTNSFTTARLRAEQDAFDEIEDLRDEAIDAEMDRQRAIDNLRDDALENQRDRADALVDLEQDTQDRLQDIRLNANRSREDIEQDYQDAYQDIQRQRVFENLSDDESVSQLTELGRERNRDLRDVDTRSGRRREDVGIRQGRQTEGINTEAQEQLTEIQIQTAALQSLTAITESETAMMNTGLLETQSQTAITASATAMTDSETAALNATTVGSFDTGVVAFGIGTETLAAAALELSELDLGDFAGALQELPLSLDVLTETLEALPSRLDEVFSTNFNILPSLLASYLQTSPTGNAPGTGAVSGGAGRTGDGEVVIDVTLNNMLTLPDGATAELGSNQHRLRAQRRSS